MLPITHGEDDIYGHGFGLPGFFRADQSISINGPGFSLYGQGFVPACTTALPCTPGTTFQSSWLSGPVGLIDLIYQGNFLVGLIPSANATADFTFTFDSFVLRARDLTRDGVDDITGVFGVPFTAVGTYRDPTVQGGQQFDFVGQGTMDLALNADGPNWDLQFARLVFTAPEPSYLWAAALMLLAAAFRKRLCASASRQ